MAETSVRSYDKVTFDFWSSEISTDLIGQVKDRGTVMVIDIPRQKGQGPFLLRGRSSKGLFSGINESPDHNAPEVEAEWYKFSDQYAGVWVENGYEMLFQFRLPRNLSNGR